MYEHIEGRAHEHLQTHTQTHTHTYTHEHTLQHTCQSCHHRARLPTARPRRAPARFRGQATHIHKRKHIHTNTRIHTRTHTTAYLPIVPIIEHVKQPHGRVAHPRILMAKQRNQHALQSAKAAAGVRNQCCVIEEGISANDFVLMLMCAN